MFIAGAVVVGGVIIAHDDHSRHSQYDDYSDAHSQYGDSQLRSEISNLESRVKNKNSEIKKLREQMKNNFQTKMDTLSDERFYNSLHAAKPTAVIKKVKQEMKEEIEEKIKNEQSELEEIDKMIAKINELTLQAKGNKEVVV